jgi:hypothetical protein
LCDIEEVSYTSPIYNMNYDFKHVHSNDATQIISALIGAFAGAIIGAFGTYIIGERARRKQAEIDEVKYVRGRLKDNGQATLNVEGKLHNLLILILKNLDHYRDIQKGIINTKTNEFRPTISMPLPYEHLVGLDEEILNVNCIINWSGVESEITLQNANLNEFNAFYNSLRNTIHEARLKKEALDTAVVVSDNNTIISAAGGLIIATTSFQERCIKVLAIIALTMEQWKKLDFTTITRKEIEEYRDKLVNYKPSEKALAKKVKELEDTYQTDKAFKRV